MTILQRRVASAGINDVDGGSTVEGGEEGGPVRNGKGNFSLLLLLRPFRNKKNILISLSAVLIGAAASYLRPLTSFFTTNQSYIGGTAAAALAALAKDDGVVNAIQIERRINQDAALLLRLSRQRSQFENSNSAPSSSATPIVALDHHACYVVVVGNEKCSYPRFWVRLVGDALVSIHMVEDDAQNNIWRGTFDIPVEGSYRLDVRWYGCSSTASGDGSSSWSTASEPLSFQAAGHATAGEAREKMDETLFAPGSVWLSTLSVSSLQGRDLPSYVWMNPKVGPLEGNFYNAASSKVSTEGTLRHPHDFYEFRQLSNYELVCFMGSQTMADIRKAFLDLRGQIHPGQRPFKFHYYNISSFVEPDRDWSDDTRKRLRKCKHILVSLDEPIEPVSQEVYREQVTAFVGHSLKVTHEDETFPIWFFSVTEPPMRATNCHSPVMRRTSDHPCNDVLKDLFGGSKTKLFPERVHFLDNTDLSMPQLDDNRADVLAVIALRIFVLVGKRVAEWRAAGQKGNIDVLHRNGVVEPNFELVPYKGW